MYRNPQSPAIAKRQAIEIRIIRKVISLCLEAGYKLSVFDGEEYSPITRDRKVLMDAIYNTDEDCLYLF